MRINDEFYVTKGPRDLDYCLVQKYTGKDRDKNPKELERVIGYYPSLTLVAKSVLKVKTIENIDIENLNSLIEKLEQIESSIVEAVNEK